MIKTKVSSKLFRTQRGDWCDQIVFGAEVSLGRNEGQVDKYQLCKAKLEMNIGSGIFAGLQCHQIQVIASVLE